MMIRMVLFSSLSMAFVAATAVSSSSSLHQHGHGDMLSVPVKRPDMELLLRQRREASLTPNFCMTGFIMDRFCIVLTTLLDNPSLRTLQNPDQHSVHCLIEVPSCVDSGYELLSAPAATGGDYGRVIRFDEVGNVMLVALAKEVGVCSTCNGNGTIQQGLSLTVIGYLANNETAEDGTPPLLNVTGLEASSVGCSDFASVGVTAPTTAPDTSSTPSPTTVPVSSPTDAPVSSPTDSVSSTFAPVATTSAPVASTTAPVATTSAPVASTTAPVATTTAPVASTTAPVASTTAPVATPSAPVAPTTKSSPTATSAATMAVHSCQFLAGVAILIMGFMM